MNCGSGKFGRDYDRGCSTARSCCRNGGSTRGLRAGASENLCLSCPSLVQEGNG